MPRSRPQDTRRHLFSAAKAANKVRANVEKVLPWEMPFEEWDNRYKAIWAFYSDCWEFVRFVDDLLNPEGEEGGVESEGGV